MQKSKLKGFVKSAELASPLSNVVLSKYNRSGILIDEQSTDIDGAWEIDGLSHDEYITFSKEGYVSKVYEKDPGLIVRLLEIKLIGYQDKLWFLPGEEINVYVQSPVAYNARLYRHGLRKEKTLQVLNLPKQSQKVPDHFFVEDGLSWETSFSYKVPLESKPGLYSLLLDAEGQDRFAIPMVISTPYVNNKNELLVLASTNTWQSYNVWGGRSRYRNFEYVTSSDLTRKTVPLSKKLINRVKKTLPKSVVDAIPNFLIKFLSNYLLKKPQFPEWMFKRLSIRRPFTNCDLESDAWEENFTNHLAGGEWRVIAWLEMQNINYDIITGAELHFNPDVLTNYKAILFSTHCEYWSCGMYKAVRQYHEKNGLWIINISGNSMYRQVEFFEDGSTRCVSLSFSDSCDDEALLLGVRYTDQDYGTCAPYEAIEANHWVFEGTSIKSSNRIFGQQSLNQNTNACFSIISPGRPSKGLKGNGASGWETDKLSSSAPKEFKIVAKGMNLNGGADMVIRESVGERGGVFSASSIVFGASLSIDQVCSTIVKNVLKRAMC